MAMGNSQIPQNVYVEGPYHRSRDAQTADDYRCGQHSVTSHRRKTGAVSVPVTLMLWSRLYSSFRILKSMT